jgi:hypothetical protein
MEWNEVHRTIVLDSEKVLNNLLLDCKFHEGTDHAWDTVGAQHYF